MNYKILHNKIFIYSFFTILAFIARYYLFEGRDSWHDEWHSIYVADPHITNKETLLRYYGDKGDVFLTEYYPPLYLFILKYFFLIFGYTDDNGRWLSLIFGTAGIPLAMYLTEIISNIKKTYLVGFLITFNLFLTWQSIEIRAHSLFIAFSLINIILFYKLIDQKKLFHYLIYIISSVFLLSLWPITGAIFFGKVIYLIKKYFIEKKIEIKIFLIFGLILFSYIIFNFDYLIFNISRDSHYTHLYESFFYNYHFRSFFGSKILGAIFLVIFFLMIVINAKKIIFFNDKENIIIYIIISSYFLTLAYTLLKASIMSPKYVLFILPLIIIWIGTEIDSIKKNLLQKKIFEQAIIIITLVFFFIEINNSPMSRPPTKMLLGKIEKQKIKYIITAEPQYYNNYLRTKKTIINNDIVVLNKGDDIPATVNRFWFVCLNKPLFAAGNEGLLANKPQAEKKCIDFIPNNKGFVEKLPITINIQDYLIRKFERN